MKNNFEYVLIDPCDGNILREYETLNKVFEDLIWKDLTYWWIGEEKEKQAYTGQQFVERYANEWNEFRRKLDY